MVAGFAKGGAVVRLVEEGGETTLTYEVDAQVGGKIAQVGARHAGLRESLLERDDVAREHVGPGEAGATELRGDRVLQRRDLRDAVLHH